jgi:TetR/AcrR family transcriptional repressor of nem operon
MAALMEATGLEKGGIYRHFSSKQAVAAEAFDYAWRGALDARMHDLDTDPGTTTALRSLKRPDSTFVISTAWPI